VSSARLSAEVQRVAVLVSLDGDALLTPAGTLTHTVLMLMLILILIDTTYNDIDTAAAATAAEPTSSNINRLLLH
jgi:hypothetical protein